MDGAQMYLALLWRKCQVKPWSNFGMHLRALLGPSAQRFSLLQVKNTSLALWEWNPRSI